MLHGGPEDLILDRLKEIAVKFGGNPRTQLWEVITALFGWTAIAAFPVWFIAALLGFSDVARGAMTVFGVCLMIALKRDLIRLAARLLARK